MTSSREHAPRKSRSSKATIYFTIAWLLAFVLALVWSISASFVYLLLPLIALFVFQGSRHLDRVTVFQQSRKPFGKKTSNAAPTLPAGSRKAIVMLVAVIAGMFGIILAAIIILDPDATSEAEAYYSRGNDFYYLGQFDSARQNFNRALRLSPEYPDAYNAIGNMMLEQQFYDSAFYYYNRALQANPEFYYAAYNKALVHYRQSRYEACLTVLTDVLEDFPEYWDAWLLAGDAHYMQQKYEQALPYYEQAYANGIRSRDMCYIMAFIYDTLRRYEQAIELYKETLAYDNDIPQIYARLGELLPGEDGAVYRNRSR
jgi:hypothetical protein